VQSERHEVFATRLPVVTPPTVWPGARHADLQEAYVLLQLILQFVTVEVCASRIRVAACASPSAVAAASPANTINRATTAARIMPSITRTA
jgi:hypothetical protein